MRYQYSSQGSKFGFSGLKLSTPNGVKLLLIINIAVFFLIELSGMKHQLFLIFGLIPNKVLQSGFVWQFVTYLFLHANLMHLAVNMFVLWMFGRELEHRWGKHKFLEYFFITGVGSGIITFLFSLTSNTPVVGASGAIYGLLLAYGLLYPNRTVYLYMFIPIKIKYFVIGLAVVAFLASLSPLQSTVSHLTHLSGMGVGFIYLKSGFRFRNIKICF
ncbi:MAG: rhomboid family intramembrane serine protease [Candidatus Marinimicrobia bacterium]|nr:rhomboid family intramembrane serine protease [Candidatus Neomarinimicrobiota bacterium]MBL7023129.1 rhomboid family intramembrane serine protease [Candidatus Neomarinimicrobiota bacterium]MBL7109063.1 rhomboid family intramembrane serine protease [Candidatus Neomarinimicrobiota bacterium]